MSSAVDRQASEVGFAVSARCDGRFLRVTLSTGRIVREPVKKYPFLAAADPSVRRDVEVIAFGAAIRWPRLDEDLGVNTILGVSEEDVARAAGYTIHSSHPWRCDVGSGRAYDWCPILADIEPQTGRS